VKNFSEKEVAVLVEKYLEKKGLPSRPALSFSDVTIVTKYSAIPSRSALRDFRVNLSRNFSINLPIVSANMQDVTGPAMAVALARLGGLGFLPQFDSLEARARAVRKVKRVDNERMNDPLTILNTATLGEARKLMEEHGVSSILVVSGGGILCGILTSRDYRFKESADDRLPIESVMTSMPLKTADCEIMMEGAMNLFDQYRIEKLPLVDDKGKLCGLISAKDIEKRRQYPNAVRDASGRLAVGVGLRLSGDHCKEAELLLEAGADVLLLDTARAGSELAVTATRELRKNFPGANLVVGNIDNPNHVALLAEAGADCVKVGIGPGARCKTRLVAGVGTPQLYAIASCAAAAEKLGVRVIGDGGIRGSDDMEKALVAGADAVMLGSLLAGTDESPGELEFERGQLQKKYRGSASKDHQKERIQKGSLGEVRNPEGESASVPYAGSADRVVKSLIDGLRSSMSYVGSWNLKEYRDANEFLWISSSGYEEGKPRI
jgi:IMP dehydrogenase